MINYLLRLLGFFDLNGLKYSKAHLKKIRKNLLFQSLERLEQYVDYNTKRMVQDPGSDAMILKNIILWEGPSADLNATSIGNLAYIALNHPNKFIKIRCKEILNELKRQENKSFYYEPVDSL